MIPTTPSTELPAVSLKPFSPASVTPVSPPHADATPEQSLSCISTNCLSLFNKLSELRQLVFDREPSLIALTETWLVPDVKDSELDIPNFSLFRSDSPRGRCGGVALYLSNKLEGAVLADNGLNTPHLNTLWITLPLEKRDRLLIGLIYRSPATSEAENNSLLSYLSELSLTHHFSHLLLMGDFNAPNLDWLNYRVPNSGFSKSFFEIVIQKPWFQHVQFPTRSRSNQIPSLLDLVISNERHYVDTVESLPPLGSSDHSVLVFDFICYWRHSHPPVQTFRNFSRANFIGMRNFLNETSFAQSSADSLFIAVQSTLLQADLTFIPRKIARNSRVSPLPRPIRRLLDLRSKLYAKQLHSQDPRDIRAFRDSRNACKSAIRRHHQYLQSKVLDLARRNKNSLFRFMKRKRQNKPSALTLRKANGTTTSDGAEVAELFRAFYETLFAPMSLQSFPLPTPKNFVTPLEDVDFTVGDVQRLLSSLNPFSAMGPDGIHPRILKEVSVPLSEPFHKLLQISLSTGSIPLQWRDALVVPIYKSGDRHSPVSYRPISLTCIPCKIMERILKQAILRHLTSNSLLSSSQHGFLPNRSCTTNLLIFMDSLTEARDVGLISDAVFFDFAKAFDRVPHAPLLSKMHALGIRGSVYRWIEAFLGNRSFKVKTGQTLSESSPISSGVPQGSVLGPLLFLIFITDLPDVVASNVLLYADDLKIWNSDNPAILQADINAITAWSNMWGLPLNFEKCVHMAFGGESGNHFTISGSSETRIASVTTKKELGVLFTSSLSFSDHHLAAAKKGFAVLAMIKRTFPRIQARDFHTLYGVYVRPLLEYASQVVHSGLCKDALAIERVQRRATKLVCGLRNIDYPSRLRTLNLFPLEYRRLRGDLIFTFFLFRSGLAEKFFIMCPDNNRRGHDKKIYKRRPRTFLRQHFFSFRIVDQWNRLPSSVTDAGTTLAFKSLLDACLNPLPPKK